MRHWLVPEARPGANRMPKNCLSLLATRGGKAAIGGAAGASPGRTLEKKRIKVLHLLLSLETGGMERFVYEHCLALNHDEFDVSVCCIDRLEGFSQNLLEHGIKVDLLQRNQQHFDCFFPFRLSRYLKENDIDIIHTHTGSFFHGSVAGFLARTKGVIFTEHGRDLVETIPKRVLDKIASFFADHIVTVSKDLEHHLIQEIKLPANKIRTIINGVNTETYCVRGKSKILCEEFGLQPTDKIVGTIGRLAEIKNHPFLIRSFEKVKHIWPDSRLILVGSGPREKWLKSLTVDLGLADSVIFTGNRNDVGDLYQLFDVFVLSSFSEGTSFSLLEAMASGVPAIVTNVGGNPGIVKDTVNGYLVEVDDDQALADKILNVFEQGEGDLANNARQFVIDRYSLKKNLQQYVSIYRSLGVA